MIGSRVLTFFRSAVTVTGAFLMMLTDAGAAPKFKLKPPQYYFEDLKTLALLSAALKGDAAKAKELVAQGANPNDEGPRSNQYHRLRLLHYAIAAGNTEAVKTLIAVGADPEMNAQGFGEAFLFVMTLEKLDMMSVLLDLWPVEKLSASTLKAMLFESVIQPCKGCLEILLDRGAPIDFPDGAKSTIMMSAMDAQDYDLAEWILARGASVHVVAGGGVTPAYCVEYHLKKYIPGSPTYNKVLHLKKMMQERGAVFPAPTPAEVRAKRKNQ